MAAAALNVPLFMQPDLVAYIMENSSPTLLVSGTYSHPCYLFLYAVYLLLPSNSDKKSWIVVTQVYGYRRPTVVTAPTSSITHCVQAATSCVRSNRLQPNPDKIEVQCRATAKAHHQLPTSPLLIDGCSITPIPFARDLGVYIDCELSM